MVVVMNVWWQNLEVIIILGTMVISVGAVVNRTNGNGLILIDQHDHLGRQAGVRVQCNDDGGHSFRPLTNGECYLRYI